MTGSGTSLLFRRSALKALMCLVPRYYQGKKRRQSTACGLACHITGHVVIKS